MVSFLFFMVMLSAHAAECVFNNLPDDAKVNIARYLGSHSNGLLKQTNNANSRIVDTVREDELREIESEYKQLIDATDMTAEIIQTHSLVNPLIYCVSVGPPPDGEVTETLSTKLVWEHLLDHRSHQNECIY